jgi:hypothetical protein
MCGKPGKGRHGTSHHAKAIYQIYRYLSFYWKKWFYIWYMALAWWLVPCLPFPDLPHIYFLFTMRLRIFHVCRNENFRNSWSRCAVNLERGDTVQVTMPKPYIKYKIISSSRSWDICYESVNGRTDKWTGGGILSMTWRATSCFFYFYIYQRQFDITYCHL